MGKLSRGITYQVNEYITAAKLYALIDTAIAQSDAYPGVPALYDVVMGDLLTVRAIHTASSPSSPSTNDLAVGSDGMLNRYNGSAFIDLVDENKYLVNNTSFTLVTGTPVVADPTSAANCKLWGGSGRCYEPLGVSAGVCAPSATAAIRTTGVQIVRVGNSQFMSPGHHLAITAPGATSLGDITVDDDAFQNLTDVLAIALHGDPTNPSSGLALAILVH